MKKALLCVIVFVMALLPACTQEPEALPDTYVEGSDYQYTQCSPSLFFSNVQVGDGVVYLFHQGFIYYLESGSDKITPLCNKADCLHDAETDMTRRQECNAYVRTGIFGDYIWDIWSSTGIALCDGYIYCLDDHMSTLSPIRLYRFSTDGVTKETVYEWNGEEHNIGEWIIHRGVLYYAEIQYLEKDGQVVMERSVRSLPLDGHSEPTVIYTVDENLSVLSLGSFRAYGNHMYFQLIGLFPDGENPVASDGTAIPFDKTYVLDIRDGSLGEITVPNMSPTASVKEVQPWQDRLVVMTYDFEMAETDPSSIYISNLDGSDPRLLLDDLPQIGSLLSDGEYLYYYNDWLPDIDDWLSNPAVYTVFDAELNTVDTYTAPSMPTGRPELLPVGGEDYMYYVVEGEAGNWGALVWDKSGMGSYNGSSPEAKLIWR